MKSAVVIGGTGLIGQKLTESLLGEGYNVKILSRDKSKIEKIFGNRVTASIWNGYSSEELAQIISGSDVLVNLTGHTIAVPWSKSNKAKIWNSRVSLTKVVARAINHCELPPKVFIQASAVGYYSHNSADYLNENSPKGAGFLSNLTAEWEKQAMLCSSRTRVTIIRTGIVLSNAGGFLPKILKPLKLYCGTILGSGKQIIPWIHIDDHVSAIMFLAKHPIAEGAFNLTSPNPVSFSSLIKGIAKRVQKPVFLRIPSFLLRLALGHMANEVLLSSQNVEPKKLMELGFEWKFSTIEDVLNGLILEQTTQEFQ